MRKSENANGEKNRSQSALTIKFNIHMVIADTYLCLFPSPLSFCLSLSHYLSLSLSLLNYETTLKL